MEESLATGYQASSGDVFDGTPPATGRGGVRGQFVALFVNDLRLIKKRFLATLLYVITPSLVVLGLWGLDKLVMVDDFSDQPVPLLMSKCAAFDRFGKVTDERSCVSVMYAPNDAKHNSIMQQLSEDNGLQYGVDVVGKPTDVDVANYVMSNLGTVDLAVIFDAPDRACASHVAKVQAACTRPVCSNVAGLVPEVPGVDMDALGSLASVVRETSVDVFAEEGNECAATNAMCASEFTDLWPWSTCDVQACREAICQMTANLQHADCVHSAEDDEPAFSADTLASIASGLASSGLAGGGRGQSSEDMASNMADFMQEFVASASSSGTQLPGELQKSVRDAVADMRADPGSHATCANVAQEPQDSSGLHYEIWYNNSVSHNARLGDLYAFNDMDTIATRTGIAGSRYVALQRAVDQALVSQQLTAADGARKSVDVGVDLKLFSLLDANDGHYRGDSAVGSFGDLFMSVGCSLSALLVLHTLSGEKADHLLAALRVIGLNELAYWAAWTSAFFIPCVGAAFLSTSAGIALDIRLYSKCSFSVHFVAMILFLQSYAAFAGCLSSFVKRPRNVNAMTFGLMLFAIVFTQLSGAYQYSWDTSSIFMVSLCSILPFYHYCRVFRAIALVAYDADSSDDFGWDDMSTIVNGTYLNERREELEFQEFSPMFSLWMMVFCVFFYAGLSWYLGQVFAKDEGGNLPWNFPFKPSYWGFSKPTEHLRGDVIAEERELSRSDHSVRCYKLSKAYEEITALSELTMSINDGTLLAVLGHNGAGKTTLIKVLNGVHPPTHGEAFIFGMSVKDELSKIQDVMGCCPQDDVLWTELTARHHLELYARFKGTAPKDLTKAVDAVLSSVALLENGDQPVRNFSGGMKRRLSVGISMIGSPEIIFLDEPTTGMDPLSRRRVWSMIEQLKQGRCVFLTTHSMEEADFLGDSIAIMHTGKLRASGSSLFLKTRFGKGHTISLLTDTSNTDRVEAVARELPGSEILSSASGNISISIPRRAVSGIPSLFQKLMPADGGHLIKEWGISNTTLEEVFLRLCSQNSDVNAIAEEVSGSEELSPDGFMEILAMMQTAANASAGDDISLTAEEQAILERAAELAALLQSSSTGVGSVIHNARQLADRTGDDFLEDIAGGGAIVGLRQSTASQQQSTFNADTMLQFVCPDGTGPGQQVQVQDPSTGNTVVVTLPPGAVPGQPVQARVASQHATSDAGGLAVERAPTVQGQALNTMTKSFKLQKSQRKANCCYCCVFILMLIVDLMAGLVDSTTSQLFGGVVYCPVGDYQKVDINGISTCDLPDLASYMALSSSKTEHMYRFTPSWSYLADSVGESTSGEKDEQPHVRIWAAGDAPGISIHEDDCFGEGTLTRGRCCDLAKSDIGDTTCWEPASPWRTYDRCCALVDISRSSDLTARVLQSQKSVQSEFHSLEDTQCDDYDYRNDENVGYYIENRTSAITTHQYLFPNFGIQYDEFTASEKHLHLHYTLEFFQRYRYGGDEQSQFFRIFTQADPRDDDGSTPMGPGASNRGEPQGPRGEPRGPRGSGRGGKGRGRRGEPNCDILENQDTALDAYDLSMLENTMTNAVLRAQHSSDLITTSFVAMPQLTYADNSGVGKLNIQILLFPLTTMILLPSVAQLYTMEREDGLLHAMQLASMEMHAYWIGMYLFTVIYTFAYSFLYVMCGYAAGLNAFTYPPMALYCLLALTWAHTQAALAMLCSAVFTKARMATVVTVLAVLLTSISGYVITNALDVWPTWLYVFLPFAYTSACSNLMVYNGGIEFYKAIASLFFGSSAIIAAVVVDFRIGLKDSCLKKVEEMIMEARKNKSVDGDSGILMQNFNTTVETEDSDVAEERRKIADCPSGDDAAAIVVRNMVKEFDMGVQLPKKVAVRDLCLTINKGEVFGLLGQNGAGKTTTINLLTGLHTIDGGSASIGGLDAATQQQEIHRIIGVCPQFDKVWTDLTVRQHLEFYARVKGISTKHAHIAAREVAMKVGLDGDPYGKLASSLSGGMRRRLSIAIALIGNPDVVFFDEPTTGLDPETRRQLWTIIKQEQSNGRCVIITTHSMEEADALCTRIGIMGFGQLRCIGTQMHLKNKFGDGFKLTLNCIQEGQDVSALLGELCPAARLVHSLGRQQTFVLPMDDVDVAKLFNTLELQKRRYGVTEWGISQASLEEVFIKVAAASEEQEGLMGGRN